MAATLPYGQPEDSDSRYKPATGLAAPASIRYNNPGAMYPGASSQRYGSTGTQIIGQNHQIAVFPTPEAGAAAHFDLLNRNYTGMPLSQAINKWSGGNSVPSYMATITKQTGLSPDTPLTRDMLADPKIGIPLAKSMAFHEAGREYPLTDAQWATAHNAAFKGGALPAASQPPSPQPAVTAGQTPMPQQPPSYGFASAPPSDALINQWNAAGARAWQASRDAVNRPHLGWANALGSIVNQINASRYDTMAQQGVQQRQQYVAGRMKDYVNAGQDQSGLSSPAASGFNPPAKTSPEQPWTIANGTQDQTGGIATIDQAQNGAPTATPVAGNTVTQVPAAPIPSQTPSSGPAIAGPIGFGASPNVSSASDPSIGLAAAQPKPQMTGLAAQPGQIAPSLNSPRPGFANTPDVLNTDRERRQEAILAELSASGDPAAMKFAEGQLQAINQKRLQFGLTAQQGQLNRQLQLEQGVMQQEMQIRRNMAGGFISQQEGDQAIASLRQMAAQYGSPVLGGQSYGQTTSGGTAQPQQGQVPPQSSLPPGRSAVTGEHASVQDAINDLTPAERTAYQLAMTNNDTKRASEVLEKHKSPASYASQKFGEKAGEQWAGTLYGALNARKAANQMEVNLGQFEGALNKADTMGWTTGQLSGAAGTASNILQSLNIHPEMLGLPNAENLSQLELMHSIGSQLTASMAKALQAGGEGKSAGSNRITDADIKLFTESEPAMMHSSAGNHLMIGMLRQRNQLTRDLSTAAQQAQDAHPNDPMAAEKLYTELEDKAYGAYEARRDAEISKAGFGVKDGHLVAPQGQQTQPGQASQPQVHPKFDAPGQIRVLPGGKRIQKGADGLWHDAPPEPSVLQRAQQGWNETMKQLHGRS